MNDKLAGSVGGTIEKILSFLQWEPELCIGTIFQRVFYPITPLYKRRPSPAKWPIHLTADKTIHRIQQDLDSEHKKWGFSWWRLLVHQEWSKHDRILNRIGAALHFIQDATVPGHVVPIYHGPNIQFLGFGKEVNLSYKFQLSDPIDAATMTEFNAEELDEIIDLMAREEIKYNYTIKEAIHDNIAAVLGELETPIDINDDILRNYQWKYFFKSPESANFFGAYSVDRKGHQLFDPSSSQAVVILDNGKKIQVPQKIVNNFIKRIHRLAVISSAKYIRSQIIALTSII